MKYINEEYDYENYATSGHSLGGNLSAHAGLTAPEEMRNKITQCYSFDGPGFSNEYIAEHQDEIEAFGTKLHIINGHWLENYYIICLEKSLKL